MARSLYALALVWLVAGIVSGFAFGMEAVAASGPRDPAEFAQALSGSKTTADIMAALEGPRDVSGLLWGFAIGSALLCLTFSAVCAALGRQVSMPR